MATHSSVLAWRIPGMGEPGGLPSMGPPSHVSCPRLLQCVPHRNALSPQTFPSLSKIHTYVYLFLPPFPLPLCAPVYSPSLAVTLPFSRLSGRPCGYASFQPFLPLLLTFLCQHHDKTGHLRLRLEPLWRDPNRMKTRSAFFTVQLSHPYMTTGKTIPLTR